MTLYLPERCVADWNHARELGVGGVEYITAPAIGAPTTSAYRGRELAIAAPPLEFTFDQKTFRYRLTSVRDDTELLVMDTLDVSALGQESKKNWRGQRHRVAMWMRQQLAFVRRFTACECVFDGVPSSGGGWDAAALNVIRRFGGAKQFAVTAYWGAGTVVEYIDKVGEGMSALASVWPTDLLLSSIDDRHMLLRASDTDLAAFFNEMLARGIRRIALWRNPGNPPLTREQVERLCAAWDRARGAVVG